MQNMIKTCLENGCLVQNACLRLDVPTVSHFMETLQATIDLGGGAL